MGILPNLQVIVFKQNNIEPETVVTAHTFRTLSWIFGCVYTYHGIGHTYTTSPCHVMERNYDCIVVIDNTYSRDYINPRLLRMRSEGYCSRCVCVCLLQRNQRNAGSKRQSKGMNAI